MCACVCVCVHYTIRGVKGLNSPRRLLRTIRRERRTLVIPRLGAGGRGLQGPFFNSGIDKCGYSGSSESYGGPRSVKSKILLWLCPTCVLLFAGGPPATLAWAI